MNAGTSVEPPTPPATATMSTTADNGIALGSFDGLPSGEPDCAPASPIVGTEVKGTSATGELYGFLFVDGQIKVDAETKIAWRRV